MYSKGRHPAVQQLICIIYIISMTVLALFIFFTEQNRNYFSVMLISTIVLIIVAVILTMQSRISDHVHSLALIWCALLATVSHSVSVNNPSYVFFGAIICCLLACLYEETSIIKAETILSIVTFVGAGLYFGFTGRLVDYGLARFIWTSGFFLLAQLVLLYLIGHVTQYRQTIRDNSMSSQDMLRVVEMKRKEAQEATKAKSLFLSNMSHEIRTPINAILGMDEIILRDSNEENVIEYAGKIQSAGNTLLMLINDILDFSKIESGRMEILPEEYRTEDVFRECYDLISMRTDEKGLKFGVEVAKDMPCCLRGDALRVKQIIINILNNAVKYTEKGSVDMVVGWDPVADHVIRVKLAVHDTGIGIRKEDQEKIFASFERVDLDKNKHIEGTGLGMAITKSLVTKMEGSIHVESVYGEGSTFYVEYLQEVVDEQPMGPFVPRRQATNTKEIRRRSFIASEANVLVVDDNEMNLVVVKGLLKKCRAQVDLAASGMQCLSLITQKHYDLILMDHMMPGMDGIETYRQMLLMEDNQCLNTPVIVLTANAVIGAKEMYLQEGFAAYLPKPVNGQRLEETLLQFLPKEKICPEEEVTQQTRTQDIPSLSGVDCTVGLAYSADDLEQYQNNLRVFYRTAAGKREIMSQAIATGDMERYTIEVHALKSNARFIGATVLGELAYGQEQAAKSGDQLFVRSHWDDMITEWSVVLAAIEEYLQPSDEKPANPEPRKRLPIDESLYRKKVEKVLQALHDFEMDDALDRLRDLQEYELSDSWREAVEGAIAATDDFEYKKAEELLTN